MSKSRRDLASLKSRLEKSAEAARDKPIPVGPEESPLDVAIEALKWLEDEELAKARSHTHVFGMERHLERAKRYKKARARLVAEVNEMAQCLRDALQDCELIPYLQKQVEELLSERDEARKVAGEWRDSAISRAAFSNPEPELPWSTN